jgi:hypothetical protein
VGNICKGGINEASQPLLKNQAYLYHKIKIHKEKTFQGLSSSDEIIKRN